MNVTSTVASCSGHAAKPRACWRLYRDIGHMVSSGRSSNMYVFGKRTLAIPGLDQAYITKSVLQTPQHLPLKPKGPKARVSERIAGFSISRVSSQTHLKESSKQLRHKNFQKG